ncbi:Endonuclease/exonuclease/phosphatase [Corchorus capsularis]|uniref:Endonuclease/exonuclease/phosphatase n=1 Tax=Corchorus capsularis TaxID=210143 RepID=A0A1R3G5C8_COCAP|nr:Endonuclease/exonuclease/phosphatase [Corchorus capsularis]
MLWNTEIFISIVSYSNSHIDVNIGDLEVEKWRFTGFYGRLETNRRHESCALLRLLASQSRLPWLCSRDFNELLLNDEKLGGNIRPQRQMNLFREAIDDCGFHEIPSTGLVFTWSRRVKDGMIFEKLDRCFAGEKWYWIRFRWPLIQGGVFGLRICGLSMRDWREEIIKENWNQEPTVDVIQAIANCGRALQYWDKTLFGNVRHKINCKKQELSDLYMDVHQHVEDSSIQDCLDELNTLYDQEKVMWRQRSKVSWLKDGNRDSKFFHSIASSRKRRNAITRFRDDEGNWQSNRTSVERLVVEYFKGNFTSSTPQVDMIHVVVGLMERRVSSEMNAALDREFTKEEIKRAVFDMDLDKTAGPDECDSILSILKAFERLGIQKVLEKDKYLGMPIMIGRSKRVELEAIKDRLWKRIKGWNSKILSIAGRAVLIQVVAQAIPTYLMSCFKFPKTFLMELNQMIARIWWGGSDSRRKIHWKSWEDLCVFKLDGGLGFRDFETFNLALLAKQGWRIIHNENSLCTKVLKAKYYQNKMFLTANLGGNPFFYGEVFWRDERPGTICSPNKVNSLMDNGTWDLDLLNELFEPDDVGRILCIPLSVFPSRDTLIWNETSDGNYTVKYGYYVARKLLGKEQPSMGNTTMFWRTIWGAVVQPKIKFFLWRLWHNILTTNRNLQQRGVPVDDECPHWRNEVGVGVWDLILEKSAELGSMELVANILWFLWHNRNKSLHEFICKAPNTLCIAAAQGVRDFELSGQRDVGARSHILLFEISVFTKTKKTNARNEGRHDAPVRCVEYSYAAGANIGGGWQDQLNSSKDRSASRGRNDYDRDGDGLKKHPSGLPWPPNGLGRGSSSDDTKFGSCSEDLPDKWSSGGNWNSGDSRRDSGGKWDTNDDDNNRGWNKSYGGGDNGADDGCTGGWGNTKSGDSDGNNWFWHAGGTMPEGVKKKSRYNCSA